MLRYRLVFLLPATLSFAVRPGRHMPCQAGCLLVINAAGQVEVLGPSREATFDQAARYLRIIGKEHPPTSIPAILFTDDVPRVGSGQDSYSIIIGAEIAFAAGGIPPVLIGPSQYQVRERQKGHRHVRVPKWKRRRA